MSTRESPNMHVNPDACLTILPFFTMLLVNAN